MQMYHRRPGLLCPAEGIPLPLADSALRLNVQWNPNCERWANMDDTAMYAIDPAQSITLEQTVYEEWCNCVRRLLGWTHDGVREDWPDLFASGHTPRDAARAAVYGEGLGD